MIRDYSVIIPYFGGKVPDTSVITCHEDNRPNRQGLIPPDKRSRILRSQQTVEYGRRSLPLLLLCLSLLKTIHGSAQVTSLAAD
jgi:hypothetical protein